MDRPNPETLSFLTPGLVHQFGNLLLSIQGNAQMLGSETDSRGVAAICTAVERGSASVEFLRYLTGEPAMGVLPIGTVLERLAELLRIPVREHDQAFDLRHGAGASPLVDAGHTVVLTAEAVRRLVQLVPPGVKGKVVVAWEDTSPGATTVTIAFETPAGTLPFPLRDEGGLAELSLLAARRGSGVACSPVRMGLALRFPSRTAVRAAEA